jgi:hypothetical protein
MSGLALSVSTIVILSGPALAQDLGWAAGRWTGRLENFQGKTAERVLTIAFGGGTATCSWVEGFSSGRGSPKSCVVTNTDVTLTTGGQSTVALRRVGSALKGSWTSGSSGKSYNITMMKD